MLRRASTCILPRAPIRVLSTVPSFRADQIKAKRKNVDFWSAKFQQWEKMARDDYERISTLETNMLKQAAWMGVSVTGAGLNVMLVLKGGYQVNDMLDMTLAGFRYLCGPALAGCAGMNVVFLHNHWDEIKRLRLKIEVKLNNSMDCHVKMLEAQDELKKLEGE